MAYKDIFDKCGTDGGYFGPFRANGDRYYTLPVMESVPGRTMRFQGKEVLMWSINNYLGLAESEAPKKAAMDALEEWGVSGPMGSRMMSGNTADHIELEQALADFTQKEAASFSTSGIWASSGPSPPSWARRTRSSSTSSTTPPLWMRPWERSGDIKICAYSGTTIWTAWKKF
jgi:hypothetical protein